MNIYKAEKAIANKIRENKILCHSKATPIKKEGDEFKSVASILNTDKFAFADINDDDLYFHQSILVSTNWNTNDDIFLPEQVWAARQTPNHKPTNFNHNSTNIVGHIVGNYAINEDSELIADDTVIEDLPSKFHILTSAVIYKVWHSDAEYQERIAELIEDIEADEMFVSMECMFPDFAYALSDDGGNLKIVSRNEDTAFLSEHLRAYGGTGFYEDFKIGRAPKNIRFIGKGYTKNPANKESIVFSKDNVFAFSNLSFAEKIEKSEKNGVLLSSKQISNGDLLMSEPNKQNEELVSLNKNLQAKIDELETKLAEVDKAKYEDQIKTLASDKDVLSAKVESLNQDIEEFKKSLNEKETNLQEVTEAKEKLEGELEEIKAESVRLARIAKFESLGFDAEKAEAKVKLFENLNDEQFEAVVSEMKPYPMDDKKKDEKKDKKSKAEEVPADEVDEDGEATAENTDVDELEAETEVASAASELNDQDKKDDGTISLAEALSRSMKIKSENK